MLPPPSDLVRCLLAEESGGLEDENYDEQDKSEGVSEGRKAEARRYDAVGHEQCIEALYDVLADSDDEGADDRARDGADAAKHRRNKGLQARHCTDCRRDARIVREKQHGADGREEGADDEGHRDDIVYLDAHERARLKVLRHGAHCHAYLGVVDELEQQHYEHERQHRRHQRDHLGRRSEDAHRIRDPGYGRVVLVQAAGDVECEVLQEVAHAYGAYHDGHPRCGAQGLIRHALYDEAQQHC